MSEVQKRFHVVIDAKWSGDTGVLDEHFSWSDGTTSRRVWTLTRQADGTWRGTADDVVGEALGEVAGNALRWRYVLALPVDGKVYHVDFDDWMFLMDDKVMLNRSYMSKWGFDLGEVTLTFVKRLTRRSPTGPASASGWSAPRAASVPRWPANWRGAARARHRRRAAAALRRDRQRQPGGCPREPAGSEERHRPGDLSGWRLRADARR
jgi:hypothetical protein